MERVETGLGGRDGQDWGWSGGTGVWGDSGLYLQTWTTRDSMLSPREEAAEHGTRTPW